MKRPLFILILILFFTTSFMFFVGCNNQIRKGQPSTLWKKTPDSRVWELFEEDSFGGIWYYNKTNITKSSNIVSVWTYNIVTSDDRIRMVRILEEEDLEKSKKYEKYDHIVLLNEIDCNDKLVRIKEFKEYDDKGNILNHHINKDGGWTKIPEDSEVESLYKKVCVTEEKSVESSSDWVEFGKSDSHILYYNTVSIKHQTKDIVQGWGKIVYSDKGREKEIQNRIKNGSSTEGYDKLSYIMSLFEIDCKNGTHRSLYEIDYGKDNSVLEEETVDNPKWKHIVPDSFMDSLRKKVCK